LVAQGIIPFTPSGRKKRLSEVKKEDEEDSDPHSEEDEWNSDAENDEDDEKSEEDEDEYDSDGMPITPSKPTQARPASPKGTRKSPRKRGAEAVNDSGEVS
jgi:hypothetical protein